MINLLQRGAKHSFIQLSTNELGRFINRSQQAASRHLLDLENAGYIERVRKGPKSGIKITDSGYAEIESLFSTLKYAIGCRPLTIDFKGRVVSGMGEGAYYMSLDGYKRQFKEKLGYEPYPGTLNIKLTDQILMNCRREISSYPPILINGFRDNSRTYGWVKCYSANINQGAVSNAAVLVLERTHYDDSILEVIAPMSLKETLGIKNGDEVSVNIHFNNKPSQN